MEKHYDVVALGEILIDFTTNGCSDQGNTLFEACPGGAPCNVLAMLSKLGKKTAFVGKVGNDQFGVMLRQTIEEIGIDSRGLVGDQQVNTTLAFVHTAPDGDRSFSFYRKPGADMMLGHSEIDHDMIRQAKIFHFGSLSLTDEPIKSATIMALDVARESGCLISFDPNLRPPLWNTQKEAKKMIEFGLDYCDILKISDDEIKFVTGKDDFDEGVQLLQEQYDIKLILLTMGKNGSRAYYENKKVECEGFPVKAIETTGAGDTFCGCALNFILENGMDSFTEKKIYNMLYYANATAALITTKRGAIRSMPGKQDIQKFLME